MSLWKKGNYRGCEFLRLKEIINEKLRWGWGVGWVCMGGCSGDRHYLEQEKRCLLSETLKKKEGYL